jgi:hypothetical protein
MMTRRLIYIWILSLTVTTAYPQDLSSLRGRVTDATTGQPIGQVNILVNSPSHGVTTDGTGNFKISDFSLPATLVLSHIAYHTQTIVLRELPEKALTIRLNPKVNLLKETVITAEIQFAEEKEHITVMDFEFYGDHILILLYNHRKEHHELLLTGPYFDTVALSNGFGPKYGKQELFKDCLGECHVLDDEKARQVIIDDTLLRLMHMIPIDRFHNIVDDCLFETPAYLVFEKEINRFYHRFYSIHKSTGLKEELFTSIEGRKARDLSNRINYIVMHPQIFRNIPASIRFEEEVMYKPALLLLQKIHDTIYYFNHARSRIDVFDTTLEYHGSIPIDYHKHGRWEEEILIDEKAGKAYTTRRSWNYYELFDISLKDGTSRYVRKIPYLFPQKVMISDGFLYILNKQIASSWKEKNLYRLKL